MATSTSGMPYLANSPFSLAMISGEESVSAMKPSVALLVSGPLLARRRPTGRAAARGAQQRAVAGTPRPLENLASSETIGGRGAKLDLPNV